MIVVGTNLLAYLLPPTLHATQAEALLLAHLDWIAPALIHSEFKNVLLRAVRRKDIEVDDARALLGRAAEVIAAPDGAVDGQAVLSLALDSGCSAYDCEFVWLARDLRVPLVTADRQLLGRSRMPCLPMCFSTTGMKTGNGLTLAPLPLDVAIAGSPTSPRVRPLRANFASRKRADPVAGGLSGWPI